MFKEIIGTIIGCLPFVAGALAWAFHVESAISVNTSNISDLKAERVEISRKLDRMSERLDQIGRDVAATAAKVQK